jgi:hypothetical protein
MQESIIQTTIPTYRDGLLEDGTHGEPILPIEIKIGQGVGVSLNPKAGPLDIAPDVYIERRRNVWTINVSRDSDDIQVVVRITDDGTISVVDREGKIVHEDCV